MRVLLEARANVNCASESHGTAIIGASLNGHVEVAGPSRESETLTPETSVLYHISLEPQNLQPEPFSPDPGKPPPPLNP